MTARTRRTQPIRRLERVCVREDGSLRLAVVADTHSVPHFRSLEVLAALRPDAILHAGDIGDLRVLDQLANLAPVLAVRGNVDARDAGLPDLMVVEVGTSERLVLRILLLHIALGGPKLSAEVLRQARAEQASMVVCGHSHIPFIGQDRGIALFNPGSMGPRRFALPVVFGIIDVAGRDVRLRHVECETGQPWYPPARGR